MSGELWTNIITLRYFTLIIETLNTYKLYLSLYV